jgi:hypothetical protein
MGTPALARTRFTIGVLMATGTLATGGLAASLAVTPQSDAEAADTAASQYPSALPGGNQTRSAAKKHEDAEKKAAAKTTNNTTTKTPTAKKTVSKPKVTTAPAPKPAPAPTHTKTKGS